MDLKPCTSSLVEAYAYEDSAWVLTIQFRSTGAIKSYNDVPPEMFEDFEKAPSKGAFYNKFIRGQLEALVEEEGTKKKIVPEPVVEEPLPPQEIVEAEILTPEEQESLREPEKKKGVIEGLVAATTELVGPAQGSVVIRSDEQYVAVCERLKKKVALRQRIFDILDPIRAAVYAAYSTAQKKQKETLEPIDASIAADKGAIAVWDAEKDRIAKVAAEAARKAAEAAAETERRRVSEELTLAAAQEAQDRGDHAEVQRLFEEPLQAPPMPPAPTYQYDPPTHKVAGVGSRKNWKAELTSIEDLIVDVAAGIQKRRAGQNAAGHAPVNALDANMTTLNQLAKANEDSLRIPGVVARNNHVVTTRK